MPRPLLICALLVVACGVVFANTLYNGFHFDDIYRIQDNPGIKDFWPPWRHFLDPHTSSGLPRLVQYRPLLPLSLSINYAIAGHSLVGYHIGNLLLQAAASILVFFFAKELLNRASHWTAALVALVFAIHPVSGVTINYLCCRDLLLMQVFLVATLLCHMRMRRLGATRSRWAICLGLFALSVLSKKNALMIPVVILLFECLLKNQSLKTRDPWLKAMPYALVAAAILLFVQFALGFSDLQNIVANPSSLQYSLGQLQHHVFHYLRNFAWPFPLRLGAIDDPILWQQVVGGICLLASWILAWRWRRSQPLIVFCLLSYQTLLALTSSVIPLHTEIVPYRAYPSSVFLYLGLAGFLSSRVKTTNLILLGAALYFAIATVVINPIWRSEQSLWRHSVDKGGDVYAYVNLASALPDTSKQKEALLHQALSMDSKSVGAHLALGALFGDTGRLKKSFDAFQIAVDLQPQSAQSRFYLARAAQHLKQSRRAATEAKEAARLDPRNLDYTYFAGVFLNESQQHQEALQYFQRILSQQTKFRNIVFQVAYTHQKLGDTDRAIQGYQAHLRDHPQDAQAWFNLGWARKSIQQWQAAVEAFKTCLKQNPSFREAHDNIAQCYVKLGNTTAAQRHRALYKNK
jgi:tetratricopeptide (TPR) repeat protein